MAVSDSPELNENQLRNTSMNGRNGVSCPSAEQLPRSISTRFGAVAQRELIEQSRFSDAGIADDIDDPNRIEMLELIFQHGHLAGATDVGGQPARHRGVEPRDVIFDRDKAMNRLLLALALEVKHAGRFGLDHAFDLPQHGIAHHNVPGTAST